MIENAKLIMDIMNNIEYGFLDENGNNIIVNNPEKWDNEFATFYYLLTPDELLKNKCGVCWDQVELERKLFIENDIPIETYFICTYDGDNLPSHTFLTFKDNNKYYWFEHSWGIYKGIHGYENKTDLLKDIKQKFIESNPASEYAYTFIYEYEKPKEHITCTEFYNYIETQKLIKINEPLYFYHVVNKGADMKDGIISLRYMYDNNMFELFDKNVLKYKDRITTKWNIEKYKNKNNLTREEYLDALNLFRGKYGSSYIYFFRYPLYKELGKKIEELLKIKDIYRININDEEVQKNIVDIFYGYDMSSSDNKLLDKEYYLNVTKEEYFSKYDDELNMNFSTLNHIGIAFRNDFCPIKFLEKLK